MSPSPGARPEDGEPTTRPPTWPARRIAERGGVLGAMSTGCQTGRIQDEPMLHEPRKHDASLKQSQLDRPAALAWLQ